MFYRLFRLVVKELQVLLGNKQGRVILILPVILQLALFPFAATMEVKNSSLAIYNEDSGVISHEITQRLASTAAFTHIMMVRSDAELQNAIDTQQALLAVRFPIDFSRRLERGEGASVQAIIDGRRSNSAQIAFSYVQQVIVNYAAETEKLQPQTTMVVRNIYNPNLEFKWHVLPSLVAIITTIGCLIVTALSVAREREEGTFDQLLVSPLTPAYIMAGKAIPGIAVAMAQGTIICIAAIWVYKVPFTGSMVMLYVGMLCYGLALAGFGLFISSLCSTQQQAFLGVFTFMVPAVLLSGFVSPIENMPMVFQWLANINPLSHFIVILKGVFLKGFGFKEVVPSLWPMLASAGVTLALAYAMFKRHIA